MCVILYGIKGNEVALFKIEPIAAGVEFRRELRESIWILLGGV